jgi:hypothetical protein
MVALASSKLEEGDYGGVICQTVGDDMMAPIDDVTAEARC